MGIYSSTSAKAASPGVIPSAPTETGHRNILEILQAAGDPDVNPNAHKPAFIISRYFATGRKELAVTYREIYEEIATMGAVYRHLGLGEGSKIALAETNSREFFGSYFGGLAVGATLVSINLLALQDESSKMRYLTHMLGSFTLQEQDPPGADLYLFGADPSLQKMNGLKKVLKLKKNPLLRNFLAPMIDRFAQEEPPRGLEKLVFGVLGKSAATRKEKQELQTLFNQLPSRMRILSPEERAELMGQVRPLHRINQPFPAETVAEILYTSGTSGNPKGVALTHGNLGFTVHSLTEGTEDVICRDDVLLMGLPFFHIFGKAVMLAALSRQMEVARQGGSIEVVILPSLSKAIQNLDGVLKTIQDYKVTLLPAVPVFLEKLVQYLQLHPQKREMIRTLRVIISGGAALKQETYESLREWLPDLRIMEGYGSSEGGITLLNKNGTPGYVGFPLPGVEARVESKSAEDCEKGELWVRSPGVSRGYVYGTTDTVDLSIAGPDGWFKTGDLVSYDETCGYKIIGRESFFIKIDNEKRSPGELEDAIRLAAPHVLEAWVVAHEPGVNEKAVAVVVTDDENVTEESLKKVMNQLAKDNLITRWKIPKHLLVIHQSVIPVRFDQPFKRESAYKVIRQFIDAVLNARTPDGKPVVILHQSPDKPRATWTEITEPKQFAAIVEQYNSA